MPGSEFGVLGGFLGSAGAWSSCGGRFWGSGRGVELGNAGRSQGISGEVGFFLLKLKIKVSKKIIAGFGVWDIGRAQV